jgi:UDP-glucose 4-epimerase
MKALVTGGCGFIGSHLSEMLLAEGHEVIIIDNLACGRVENLSSFRGDKNYNFYELDIRDRVAIEPLFDGVDWVFHLAGLADIVPSIEHPDDYYTTNVTGTLNVLQSALKAGVKRVVYAASSSSYGIPDKFPTSEDSEINPQYPYALTKYMGEELVLHWSRIYKLPAISLRLFNVYGPRSRTTGAYGAVFGVFLAQKLADKPYTVVGNGEQTRDFTYVTDVAAAFVTAAKSKVAGEAINVGSGNHYSVNYLVSLLGGPVVHIPKRPGEPDCTFADIKKITQLLDWKSVVSLEEGVMNMINCIDNWKDAPVWDASGIDKATKTWFKYLDK